MGELHLSVGFESVHPLFLANGPSSPTLLVQLAKLLYGAAINNLNLVLYAGRFRIFEIRLRSQWLGLPTASPPLNAYAETQWFEQ